MLNHTAACRFVLHITEKNRRIYSYTLSKANSTVRAYVAVPGENQMRGLDLGDRSQIKKTQNVNADSDNSIIGLSLQMRDVKAFLLNAIAKSRTRILYDTNGRDDLTGSRNQILRLVGINKTALRISQMHRWRLVLILSCLEVARRIKLHRITENPR